MRQKLCIEDSGVTNSNALGPLMIVESLYELWTAAFDCSLESYLAEVIVNFGYESHTAIRNPVTVDFMCHFD